MKRNNYEQYDKGQEISGVTFQQHQNQVIESLNSVMLSLGLDTAQMTVLWGLENSGSGTDYDISAGAVFYNGEIFEVDAFTGTAADAGHVAFLRAVDIPVGDDIRFADGTISAVHIDHKYEVVLGTPSAGEFGIEAAPKIKDVLKTTVGAEQFTLDKIDELVDSAATYTTIGELETAVININNSLDDYHDYIKSSTSKPQGSFVDNTLQVIGTTEKYIVFSTPSARIQPADLVVPQGGKRIIRTFASFRFAKNSDSKNFTVGINFREGTGAWQLVRERKFWSHDTSHATMMGMVELTTSPTQYIEFSLRVVAETDSIRISDDDEIEFDTIY